MNKTVMNVEKLSPLDLALKSHLDLIQIAKKMSNLLFRIEHEPLNMERLREVFKTREEFDNLMSKSFHAGEIDSPEKFHNYKLDDT